MATYTGEALRYYGPPHPTTGADIHPVLQGSIFYPSGTTPAVGWPVVAVSSMEEWGRYRQHVPATLDGTGDAATVGHIDALAYRLLDEAKIAVFFCFLPPLRGGRSAESYNAPALDQTSDGFDPDNSPVGYYGVPYAKPVSGSPASETPAAGHIVGRSGIVGQDWPGAKPSGYTDTHPWLDPEWIMPEKAAAYIVQHLRYHSIQGTGQLLVDSDSIGVSGGGHTDGTAADSFAFPATMPDLAGELGTTDAQSMQSTRVKVADLRNFSPWWSLYRINSVSSMNPTLMSHFACSLSAPYWDSDAERFGATQEGTWPGTMDHGTGDSDPTVEVKQASPLFYGTDESGETGLDALNASVEFYCTATRAAIDQVLAVANRYKGIDTWPVSDYANYDDQMWEFKAGNTWSAYAWKTRHPNNTRLVFGDAALVDANAVSTGGGVAEDATITVAAEFYDDLLNWYIEKLTPPAPVSGDFLDASDEAEFTADTLAVISDTDITESVTIHYATSLDPTTYNPFLGSITHAGTAESVRLLIGHHRDSAPGDSVVGRYRCLGRAADFVQEPRTSDTLERADGEVLTINAVTVDPVGSTFYVLEATTVERP